MPPHATFACSHVRSHTRRAQDSLASVSFAAFRDNQLWRYNQLCLPGQTGVYPSCPPCNEGTFKSTIADAACSVCPPSMSSEQGATSVDHCFCIAGFAGGPGLVPCSVCGANSWSSKASQFCEPWYVRTCHSDVLAHLAKQFGPSPPAAVAQPSQLGVVRSERVCGRLRLRKPSHAVSSRPFSSRPRVSFVQDVGFTPAITSCVACPRKHSTIALHNPTTWSRS